MAKFAVELHSNSLNKIQDAMVQYKGSDKQRVIGEEMEKLAKVLMILKNIDITKSMFTNWPIVGPIFDNMKKEHIEKQFSDSKYLIDTLTTELSKRCSELEQDDALLEDLARGLELDIKNNTKILNALREKYKILTGKDVSDDEIIEIAGEQPSETSDTEELKRNNELIILANTMGAALTLIKAQTIYLAQISNIVTQNDTFIQNMKVDIKTSVSTITTGVIISNHLSKRNELQEVSKLCNDIAMEMAHKTAYAMKEQTEKYQQTLVARQYDDKRLDDAIKLVHETYRNFKNFSTIEMPKILNELNDKSENVLQLVNMIDASNSTRDYKSLMNKLEY